MSLGFVCGHGGGDDGDDGGDEEGEVVEKYGEAGLKRGRATNKVLHQKLCLRCFWWDNIVKPSQVLIRMKTTMQMLIWIQNTY